MQNLKVGQLARFPLQTTQILGYNQNHINPRLIHSRLLLIRMEVPNANLSLKPSMQNAQLTQSNLKACLYQ
jgi:Cu(I)/Ag(I) efflux system membrane fusion protein